MENNSYKLLRHKLKNVELPYDRKAWNEMECLLDKENERKRFAAWWKGAAMVLVLALITGYAYYQFEPKPSAVKSGNESLQSANSVKEKIKDPQVAYVKHLSTNAKNNRRKSDFRSNEQEFDYTGKSGKQALKKRATSKSADESKNTPRIANSNETAKNDIPVEYKSSPLLSISNLEIMKIDKLDGAQENAENKLEKTDDDAVELRRIKNKKIHYSLGVIASVTASTLGNQHPGFFYGTPTYAIGATHELTFMNRFAITNAIEFSQTGFNVNHATAPDFIIAPQSYVSKITEIDIPAGVKVYPIAKKKFRFYIQAGIINHIKLQETFSYALPANLPSSQSNLDASALFPTKTIFPGGNNNTSILNYNNAYNSNALANVSTSHSGTNTADFSINKGNRYYASFYSSAGFEFITQTHWIIFAEPLFFMSLEKTGAQDKTKYNLGLSNGFRYQF